MKFITEPFERFFKHETASGILLLVFTIIALIIANSGLEPFYNQVLHTKLTVGIADFILSKNLILWINDGLMAIFFFVIGLEIKRELLIGELSEPRKAVLPVSAAIGGMLFPMAIFIMLNRQPEAQTGWAIPMATDIAFSLGILKLLGKRVPLGLKVFLTAFAIVDDLGAILVIAFFYSPYIKWMLVFAALGIVAGLFILTKFRLYNKYLFFLIGLIVWVLFLKSGIHATIAGVLMALVIPIRRTLKKHTYIQEVREALEVFNQPGQEKGTRKYLLTKEETGAVDTIETLTEELQSPLQHLENKLHGWVVYLIMPIFAFANAGVTISGESFSMLSVAIALSLIVGNTIGISLISWLVIKAGLAKLPEQVSITQLVAVSILGGVGFTMSLFFTNLAYENQLLIDSAKIGILLGSLLSGVIGYMALKKNLNPE
jgi:NhaA family Na+:H+ antiporter